MDEIARVGIDLAKKVFHVTALDAAGAVMDRKRLRRAGLQSYLAQLPKGCVVAMEACGSAHHWARLAMRLGHEAVLMSPQFVAPYVKSNKNDVNDADGIAEASGRPTMRFVGVKSVAQGHIQQLHRARQMAVRNRTGQCNQIHGFLLEYGIESPKGVGAVLRRLAEVLEDADNELPTEGRALLRNLADELRPPGRAGEAVRYAACGEGTATGSVPATDGDPGDRVADGDGIGGRGGRRRRVSQRPGDGGVAQAGAPSALHRRTADAVGDQMRDFTISDKHAQGPWRSSKVSDDRETSWSHVGPDDYPVCSPYSRLDPEYRREVYGQHRRESVARWLTRPSRCEGMIGRSILAERPHHGLGVPVDDGQQNAGRPVGNAASLFPLLKSPHVETKTVGEFLPAQPKPLAEGDDPAGGRIVDDPAWQLLFTADMSENLAQRRFDVLPEFSAFRAHHPVVPFFIAATRRDSALASAGVKSSRSAFA